MTAFRRTLSVLLIVLASALAACTPGAGAPQPPAGSSAPGGNPAVPSIAPGAYGS
jgi:hypothetical protein